MGIRAYPRELEIGQKENQTNRINKYFFTMLETVKSTIQKIIITFFYREYLKKNLH